MALRSWHPGKIVLMWALVLGSWFAVCPRLFYEYTPLYWYFMVAVAAVVTWRWFTAREKGSTRTPPDSN